MPITWNYIKTNDRYAQTYRLLELLRLEHNKEGAKYKQGLISLIDWRNYLNHFEDKQDIIFSELLKLRKQIKENTGINTSLTDVIV